MKKISIIITFLFCAFFCISCEQNKKTGFIIGVSQCSNDEWRMQQNKEMIQETAFYPNLQLDIKTVKDNSQAQIEDIRLFIEQKVDLLIISPNEAESLTPIVEEAYRAGIPVILIERKIASNNYTAYVGADNREVGQNAGAYISGYLKNGGNVLEIRGLKGSTSDTERHEGFIKEIDKHPNIHVVNQYHADWYKQEAENAMQNYLSNPNDKNVDLIFAMNDRMASGVFDAYKNHINHPPIVGVDALSGDGNGIDNILKGKMTASIIYPTGGDKIVQIAMKILQGEPYLKENTLKTAIVDKENARVISMQNEQLQENQSKLQRMNDMLDHSMALYKTQQMLFYATIALLVLASSTLIISFWSYRTKNKANKKLKHQNEEIKRQASILKTQKEEVERLSEQLKDATHAKLMFFTNISHEFKTPLALILGPVDTLLMDGNLDDGQKELLTLVKRNSNRLLHLISEIIEFRRFENGKMETHFSKTNLKDFIEELSSYFKEYIKNKRIDFQINAIGDSFDIILDKEKIEKIYFNILSNAFKHVNSGGEITVSLQKKEDKIEFSIHNSGSFIPIEEQKNIFDRFYKLKNTDGSTGIGLSLVSSLVEIHNGSIELASDIDKGTTFYVTLPAKQIISKNDISVPEYNEGEYIRMKIGDEVFTVEDDILPEKNEDNDKPIVLIIEDNADMRKYLHRILTPQYNILEAENGSEGINKAIKNIPDLIISDVMMPEKDGFDVCRTLKENISTSHIPIIVLTACSLDEQKAIGFESGAEAYIPKPFNAEILKIRIRKLIESRRKMKEAFGNNFVTESKRISLADIEQTFIDNFKTYVDSHISNPDLNVDDIAKSLGMSRVQLYRKVKSLTNYPPNELVRIIRLKYATQLLSSRTRTIAEVAYESGFSSPSYFSKCFKEFYNENPTDFLK